MLFEKNYEIICRNKSCQKINDLLSILIKQTEINRDFVLTNECAEFRLSKRLYMRNSFNPVFVGQIFKSEDGFTIKGGFSYCTAITILMGLFCVFLVLFATISISILGIVKGILVLLSMVGLIIAFDWLSTKSSLNTREEILEFIRAACK